MSLKLIDEYDPKDWDTYFGKGPMRTIVHYVCTRCDKTRCHFAVEVADDGKAGVPRDMVFDKDIRMPCPLEQIAVFERNADPEERGWAGTKYGSREERDMKDLNETGRRD